MKKGVVQKLMDGAVDNPGATEERGCPRVVAQAAHELLHDELFG